MLAKAVRQSSPCFACVGYARFTEMHVKWSVILADRFGPEILTMLEIKGQVLHRVKRVHLKVPGWLSDLKTLLTRTLPMFLSEMRLVVDKKCV